MTDASARRAWDPTHLSASVERQVKIRACLDLATVLLTIPSAYRGVLSDLFARITDKVEQGDKLARGLRKLEKLKAKGETPYGYASLKLPTVQHQAGSRDQWNELWVQPGEDALIKLKRSLLDSEISLVKAQIERVDAGISEREAIKEAWTKLREHYEARPKSDHYRLTVPDGAGTWPDEPKLEICVTTPLLNELKALQVDLPTYFRKVVDLKLDLIERIHGKKDKKAAEKRDVDMAVQDIASTAEKKTTETMKKLIEQGIAAALKQHQSPGASSSKQKLNVSSVAYHQNPTNAETIWRQFVIGEETGEQGSDPKGKEEGEEGFEEGRFTTLSQGGNLGSRQEAETSSWRRFRSQEEWARREGKRKSESVVEVLKSKPWTFGVPASYPDEILTLPFSYQANVLLSRAPVSLLDANRFRSPIHVQPGLNVPIQIQHDLSASLKFMFETKIDGSLIEKAYVDLMRRIRWKWHFIDQENEDYDPDYDVTAKLQKVKKAKKPKQPPLAHPHIERGLSAGQAYVTSVLTAISTADKVERKPEPLNLKRAREFMVTNNLIVTSTDKNLGVAVFKRDWIYDQACALFGDEDNYTSLAVHEAVTYLSSMANEIRELCETHLSDQKQLSTFLCHCIPGVNQVNDWANWKQFVPEAYAIPKIHKNPWKGRPICPGHSLPQNPASKFLAKTIRPLIETCPWVIKGSKDFVQKLQDVKIPSGQKAFIVSADVVAFYPSVDTAILRQILSFTAENTIIPKEVEEGVILQGQEERRLDFYNRMFRLAVSDPVMTFNDKILNQHKGLPMGAAGSPDAANIFAAWYEFEWIERVESDGRILFYGRYLDDIYCIVLANTPDEALEILSFISLGDVKLLWEPPSDQANFLDLATRIDGDRIFHEPFVKAMSHRERIPWSSAHPLDVKRGTFSSEISRLATLCSDHSTYVAQCDEAVNLYIGRGYPKDLVTKWLKDQKVKRWEDRVAVKSAEDPARTFFTLKTQFNEAWKYFNVGELQTRILAQWDTSDTNTGGREKRRRTGVSVQTRAPKRARIALQGQQWSGQSRLHFVQEDGGQNIDVRLGGGRRDEQLVFNFSQVAKWSQQWVNTAKFLVSRKKNTQLWDITRQWNKAVWDTYLSENGMLRPFDASYEGLVILNESNE